jgi:tetratricopeptide (TPR) repeat protein
MIMRVLLMACTLGTALALSPMAFAAGDSSGSDSTKTESPKKLKCKKGEVIKVVKKDGVEKKTCAKVTTGILPDEELYEQGRLLAKEGEYDWALDVLAAVSNQNDPKVLNYTGYSHRKAGRLEIGITYYRKALAINPDFVLAREYLGEGYVAAGRIDLARAELAQIAQRCGETCEEFKDLKTAIDTAIN